MSNRRKMWPVKSNYFGMKQADLSCRPAAWPGWCSDEPHPGTRAEAGVAVRLRTVLCIRDTTQTTVDKQSINVHKGLAKLKKWISKCVPPVEAIVVLWNPSSHYGQNPNQVHHVAPQVGEVGLHAEVLQAHLNQNLLVLLRRFHQELSGETSEVP